VGALAALALWLPSALSAARDIDKCRHEVFFRVRPSDARAWRLCEIADALSKVEAWRDRTVDSDRRVPTILWAAIRRSLAVDQLDSDAERAATHPTLADLVHDMSVRVEDERAALDRVQLNLGKVLLAARSIDQHRMETARVLEEHREREQEAAELRKRLTRNLSMNSFNGSDEEADQSAGAAIEADVVAGLLHDSDRILRDSA
jgi:hypothetical protein